MIITCGFVGKSAGYYYYIQNIILNESGWTNVKILCNNTIIKQFTNIGKEIKIEMLQDNSYNILLKVDDKIVKISRELFKVDIDVTNTNENFYKYEEGLIVDH